MGFLRPLKQESMGLLLSCSVRLKRDVGFTAL